MAFDRRQAEEVFERALEIDEAAVAEFDQSALQRLADEMGVSEAAMSQAIAEATGGRPGPRNAVAEATIPAAPSDVGAALDSFFRLRGLSPSGTTVWHQTSGWWPDLYRFTAITPVAVSLSGSESEATVRLTARLDRIWRSHLLAALLAPLVLVMAFLRTGSSVSLGLALGAVVWMTAAAWTYQQRRDAVARRLAGALGDVSNPAYRFHPW